MIIATFVHNRTKVCGGIKDNESKIIMGIEGIDDKYVNPYTDFSFKLLFGTAMNKELLISFLNALLFRDKDESIFEKFP